jgi:uncharacterized protein YqgC (DUF456 family)
MDSSLTAALAGAAMLVGLAGTVVPVVPGLSLIWLAGLFYGIAEGFGAVGTAAFVAITVLAAVGTVAGVVLPHRAAGAAGAARTSLLLGLVAAVVGFFAVPVVGFPLGGVLGIFVGEQLRTRDVRAALRTTRATLVGFGVAALVQVGAGMVMIACWLGWVIAG